MTIRTPFLVALLMVGIQAPLAAQGVCQIIAGATVVANDGQYLGKLTNAYDAESIFNEYGSYGSQYSAKSIWNEYGRYGGEYSAQSPFNAYSSTPPSLIKNGEVIGHLTVNRSIRAGVNPYVAKSCEF